jgi:hypothetical protein
MRIGDAFRKRQSQTKSMVCKGTVTGDTMKLSIDNLSEGDHRQATAVRKTAK